MTNRPKNLGTQAETAVARYLTEHGWPSCERRSLKGGKDQGDITGTPGVCWEVKYANSGIKMSEWMGQTEEETYNARANLGILVAKPKGVGMRRVGRWLAITTPVWMDQMIAASHVVLEFTEPITYQIGKVTQLLESHRDELDGALRVVQAIPPRLKHFPQLWYRVMYLEEMVTLLHKAGYGDEDPGGVSPDGS